MSRKIIDGVLTPKTGFARDFTRRGAGGTGSAVPPFTDPPYDYTLNSALDVPAIVQRCAGPQ